MSIRYCWLEVLYKPWFDDQCRHAFDLKQQSHLQWTCDRSRVNWEEFVHCQVIANETYSEAKCQFSARNRDVLMNAQSPHKWWSTLKSPVFSLSSSLPPLVGGGVWLEFVTATACWWRWCVSWLAKLICSQIILMASSPGSLLIFHSLAIHLRVLPPLPAGQFRSGISC